MKNSISYLLWMGFLIVACHLVDEKKPNILFVISDDQSYPHTSIYGTKWISTPGFDRVAEEGLLFSQAYTTNAKCSPSRSSILTGRNSWLLEEATNHVPYFPEKFTTFPEILKNNGYKTGFTGKGWAPGVAMKDGKKRNLIGEVYRQKKLDPPATFISNVDYFENFKVFLNERTEDQPFFFWLGGHEPHRAYEYQVGTNKGNKNIDQIDQVPDFWPDSKNIRTDMLDYAFEIEYFDGHLVKVIEELEKEIYWKTPLLWLPQITGCPFQGSKDKSIHLIIDCPWPFVGGKASKIQGVSLDDYFSFSDFAHFPFRFGWYK